MDIQRRHSMKLAPELKLPIPLLTFHDVDYLIPTHVEVIHLTPHAVFENLAGGATSQEVTRQFNVTEEQIKTVLAHAARILEEHRLTGESH